MESSTESRPSLIVKLPFTPLCSKCTDTVSRWCSPTRYDGYGSIYDMSRLYRDLTDTGNEGPTIASWTWRIGTLQLSSLTCPCCRFLLDTVNSMPGDPYYEYDFLRVSTQLLGSRHIALPQRRDAGSSWALPSLLGSGKTQTTEHKSYYRPSVRIYRPRRVYEPGEMPQPDDYYEPEHINFILPVDPSGKDSESSGNTDAFLGRRMEPRVNLPLVRSWLQKCSSTHCGKGTNSGIGYFLQAENKDGCEPKIASYIAGFCLIDIARRCVVRVDGSIKYEYAALSYVWGNARRLLLSRDNERALSAPGALLPGNTDVPKTFIDAFDLAESLSITHIWIDALCILQDDTEQLLKHMSHMEEVYSSATLTIVSDTPSADTGIPGISVPRWPPQASFTYAGTTYLSTRKTFGEALLESPWEKRAWCLQEKIFSKKLLILTEAQAFYHCGAATWFEDTILEEKTNISGPVHMRQKAIIGRKGSGESIYSIAYEAHREYFMRNFWSLVQIYSKRDISFEADTLRAFAGILKSVEGQFGPAIWGIPSFEFARGLTWAQSLHHMELRNHNFPSWSWAGWRSGGDIKLFFRHCKRSDDDLRVFGGRYHISKHKHAGRSAWDVDWHYYTDDSRLSAIPSKNSSTDKDNGVLSVLTSSVKSLSISTREGASEPKEDLAVPCKQCMSNPPPLRPARTDDTIPNLFHNAEIMPPLSHIIRFYSSVATVFISSEPKSNEFYWSREDDLRPQGARNPYYVHEVLIPESSELIGFVELDPSWPGLGRLHDLIYITRWCPNFAGYEDDQIQHPEKLNCLLLENVSGWGEVKQRVQLVQPLDLALWRKAKPRWELVSLA